MDYKVKKKDSCYFKITMINEIHGNWHFEGEPIFCSALIQFHEF